MATTMDEKFVDYLKSIKAGPLATERVAISLEVFTLLCPESIDHIFLSDRVNRDTNDRDFTSLWAFSETFWMSTKNVLTDGNADIAPYKQSIWYLGLDYRDWSRNAAAPDSSGLYVEVAAGRMERNELSATGDNCRYLWKIVIDLFRPNLRTELS